MPRLPRIQLDGAVYYITCRALRGEKIFKDEEDYKNYLYLLAKYKEQHQCKLFAYGLFRGSLYLLVETGNDRSSGETAATISVIIHDLNTSYTKYYNGRYNRRGPLFEPRFKSILVEKTTYLLKVTRAIHAMARKENLDPRVYPYGSFHAYLGYPSTVSSLLKINDEISEVTSLLNVADAVSAYERYCSEIDPVEERELQKKLEQGSVVGSDAFAEAVKTRVQQVAEEAKKEAEAGRSVSKKLLLSAGFVFLTAISLVFLSYRNQSDLRTKYAALLQQKEIQYSERARFENRNPLAPTELENTVWEVEIIPATPESPVLKDTFYFSKGRFISYYLQSKDFNSASYFLVPQGHGRVLWQSAQSKRNGDTVAWNGEWKGDVMKGTLTLTLNGKSSVLSFFSSRWGVFKS